MLRRRLRDDGVSTVVSAVLVFALILMVLSVYVSTIVPDQVSAAEARHMRRVSSALGDINTQMVGTISLGREGEFSTQIDLGTTTMSSLAFFDSSGTLELADQAFFANFLCDSPRVLARNGQVNPGATYAALGGSVDMETLVVLEARIGSYTFGLDDDSATWTVTSNGNPVATFGLTLDQDEESVRVQAWDSAARLVIDQAIQSNLGPTIAGHVINLLDPAFGFASLLADAQGGLSLTTLTTTSAIQQYAVYWNADGTMASIGQGRDLPFGFQRSIDPAVLVYRSNNARFLDQTYSLEGGAVILAQEKGQYLTLNPFAITVEGGQQLLRLDFLNMTGVGMVSGSHRATVSAAVTAPTTTILECGPPTLLISSEYPQAWLAAWSDELLRAGLDDSVVTQTGDLVEVSLTGAWTVVLQEGRAALRVS